MGLTTRRYDPDFSVKALFEAGAVDKLKEVLKVHGAWGVPLAVC
jgi:hypothetical protein